MIPKWQPVPLPIECAPFGEHPFQPYLIKAAAVVVAGGPSALFVITVTRVPKFELTIPARVRISGFAAHEGMLYVQDGPVLSRWGIADRKCFAAVNLLVPEQHYSRDKAGPDWDELHRLPPADEAKQAALQRARRKVEWLRMLEATEKQLAMPSTTITANETVGLEQLAADLRELVGNDHDALRKELASAQAAAAAHIISAPVVRTQPLGGNPGAMVFVVGRDGKIHPLDVNLDQMRTAAFDRRVRPSLAIAEIKADDQSEEHGCRLYYVTEAGMVRCIDGNSTPPKSLHEWTAQGPVSPEPGVRSRVESNLVWGSNAQNTGIFALPVDRQGAGSRVSVPVSQEWRWLEIRPDHSLAIVSTDNSCRLISYARNTKMPERFAVEPDRAQYFSSFLPQVAGLHPLLVAEFERDATVAGTGVTFRLLVANDVDVDAPGSPEAYAWLYPPPPTAVLEAELEGRGTMGPPVRIRTQPSISLQDAYLMARDKTIQEQLRDLAVDTWPEHIAAIEKEYGSRAQAAGALGDSALPSLSGRDALYCYAIGGMVTEEHGLRALEVLSDMRKLAKAIPLRFVVTTSRRDGDQVLAETTTPIGERDLNLITISEDGLGRLDVRTDSEGLVMLPIEFEGKGVTMTPFVFIDWQPNITHIPAIVVTREANNEFEVLVDE